MYSNTYIFIAVLHILNVNSDNSTNTTKDKSSVCSVCLCQYKDGVDKDFTGEKVDCAYKPNVLNSDFSLPTTVFSLDLSTNGLTSINNTRLFNSKTLKELLLSHNDIISIDPKSFNLPQLRTLDLSFNKLEFIDEEVFKTVNKLEYLNLANNNFSTFGNLTFRRLRDLKVLVLDNNYLGSILRRHNLFDANGFGLTHKLKSLSLKGIGLGTVPENFLSDVYDLRELIISNNNLKELFELPYTLEYLDVSDNPIKYIYMEDFSELPALKVLKLNSLHIKTVPDFVFSPLKSLTHLELERNRFLTDFSPLAFGNKMLEDSDDFALESLTIKYSRINTLDERLLEPFGQLIRLDLQGNPWRCDCKLSWIKRLQIPDKDSQQLRCAYPPSVYNKPVFDLDTRLFVCPMNKHHVGLIISGVSLCILFACLAIWMFIFIPRWKTSSPYMKNLVAPTAAYSVLPMNFGRDPF